MGEKKQAAEEQGLERDDVTDLAEKATRKPTSATRKETPVRACECPPGCVGLSCCT